MDGLATRDRGVDERLLDVTSSSISRSSAAMRAGRSERGTGSFAMRSTSAMAASASFSGKSMANIASGSQLRSSGPDAVCLAPGQTILSSSPAHAETP